MNPVAIFVIVASCIFIFIIVPILFFRMAASKKLTKQERSAWFCGAIAIITVGIILFLLTRTDRKPAVVQEIYFEKAKAKPEKQ